MSRVQISEMRIFFFFFFVIFFLFIYLFFLSLLLQCKFANSTLLSLLSFSNFITHYDAQASSAFSALILITSESVLCVYLHFFCHYGENMHCNDGIIYEYRLYSVAHSDEG